MTWIADTAKVVSEALQQVPLAAVMKERVELMKTKYEALEEENSALKDRIVELENEISSLKSITQQKPKVKWGCYQFEGEDNLFCPACYDTKKLKHLTTRLSNGTRRCVVCKTTLGAG
jgi:hypothetical protein